MTNDNTPPEPPSETPPKLDISALSRAARLTLDVTVNLWLKNDPLGRKIVEEQGFEKAVAGIYELLEAGVLAIYTDGDFSAPGTTIHIRMTDYGRAQFPELNGGAA